MLKKLCFIVFFSLMMWGSVWGYEYLPGETGWYGGDIVRIKCLPELKSFEIKFNNFLRFSSYEYLKLAEMGEFEKRGMFAPNNANKEDRKTFLECKIGEDLFEVVAYSYYSRMNNYLYADILKNGSVVTKDIIIYGNIYDEEYKKYTISNNFLKFNTYDNSLDVESFYKSDDGNIMVYSHLDDDELDLVNYPYKLVTNMYENNNVDAIVIECNDLLNTFEIYQVSYENNKINSLNIEELNKKGIYILTNKELQKDIVRFCNIGGKEYKISIAKNMEIEVQENNKDIIKNVKLYEYNGDVVRYIKYTDKYESWNENPSLLVKVYDNENKKMKFCAIGSKEEDKVEILNSADYEKCISKNGQYLWGF